MSMVYPAQFKEIFEEVWDAGYSFQQSNGFAVLFRDVPEAITQGDTFLEAVEMAQDALRTATDFYTERGDNLPTPGTPQHGDIMIEVSV